MKTNVIYIMGSGRSGSTLLTALLGSVDYAISVGELAYVSRSSFSWMEQEYCACGSTVNRCPLWSEIRIVWCAKTGAEMRDLAEIQKSVERLRYLHRPFLGTGGKLLAEYGRLVGALYDTIAEVSGASTIIDASKRPLRAVALARLPSINLRLIHLVRDVRGVAWSLKKRYAKDAKSGVQHSFAGQSPSRSMLYWSLINLFSEIAMSVMPREMRVRLRYEDLMSQPVATIAGLGQALDIDVQEVIDNIESSVPITFGHMVAGNRIRMSKRMSIRPDFEWKEIMDSSVQRRLWAAAWPLMRRYEYSR